MVPRGDREGAMPDRRYVVADGDRRDPNLAAARCHTDKARVSHIAFLWRETGTRRRRRQHH